MSSPRRATGPARPVKRSTRVSSNRARYQGHQRSCRKIRRQGKNEEKAEGGIRRGTDCAGADAADHHFLKRSAGGWYIPLGPVPEHLGHRPPNIMKLRPPWCWSHSVLWLRAAGEPAALYLCLQHGKRSRDLPTQGRRSPLRQPAGRQGRKGQQCGDEV